MRLTLLALASILAAGSAPLLADNIPYSNPGQLAPAQNFTASATGVIVGYFVGSEAGDNDRIELWNTTQNTFSGFLLPNHSSTVGVATTFLSVNAGDNLVFILSNDTTGQLEDLLELGDSFVIHPFFLVSYTEPVMRTNKVRLHLHRLTQLLDGLIGLTRERKNPTEPGVHRKRNRVQVQRSSYLCQGFGMSPDY